MKKLFLLLLFVTITSAVSQIQAGIPIIYHNGETANIIEKLPSEYNIDGKHVNLAVKYDQFGLFWLPVWNYGTPEYILLTDDEKEYWYTDQEILTQLKTEFNITSFSEEPTPSLWNKIGLKPVFILLLVFIAYSIIRGNKDEDKDETSDSQIKLSN